MKNNKIQSMLRLCGVAVVALVAVACEDNKTVTVPDFGVKAAKPIVRVGERAVFDFEGAANIISFYSGEEGSDYDYKDQSRILPATMYLSFSTRTYAGTTGAPNPARLPFYYSTDFSGNYTLEDVEAATWHEITDLFTMPDDTPMELPAGSVCMNDFFAESETIYLAYYYEVEAYDSAKNNGRTQWYVQNFLITGVTDNDAATVYDQSTAGWTLVYKEGYFNENGDACEVCSMPDVNSSRILFRSEFKPTVDHKVWCVSGAIKKVEDVNLGFDRPTSIKSFADPTMTSYYHIYNTPGTYTATFIGVNASVYGREEVVRQVDVEVVYDGGSISQPDKEEWK